MSIGTFLRRIRKQKAIYWEKGVADGYGGYKFDSPVEIDCRWENTFEKYRTASGDEKVSNAVIYADRVLEEGGYLKEGEIDSSTPTSPIADDDAYLIMRFAETPDIKNVSTLYLAYL